MHKHLNIGIVGTGFAAQLHLNAYRQMTGQDICLYAICSKDDTLGETARAYNISHVYRDYDEMLADDNIDLIDIITPPFLHADMVLKAIARDKHVICEKPLTGYCAPAFDNLGRPVSRKLMYDKVLEQLDQMERALKSYGHQFMYAENFVYAPAVQKTVEFLRAKGSKVLLIKGEESHSGSHAAHAPYWEKNGGGSLIRQGCHPLSAALYLKDQEAAARSEDIRPAAVTAVAGMVTPSLKEEERTYIQARPLDVEDYSNVAIEFTDGTFAQILASDIIVGGVRNVMEVYTNEGCYVCNIAPNNGMAVYHESGDGLDGVYITEKLRQNAGWQQVFLEENLMRGYIGELQDFVDCAINNHAPKSGFRLASTSMKVIYAAYRSAQEQRRIVL